MEPDFISIDPSVGAGVDDGVVVATGVGVEVAVTVAAGVSTGVGAAVGDDVAVGVCVTGGLVLLEEHALAVIVIAINRAVTIYLDRHVSLII